MTRLTQFAPAKLNLYLHITGRREDGYHDLDSLVAFADIGDEISVKLADKFSFNVEGPQSSFLAHEPISGNLVVAAAHSLAAITGNELNVAISLVKNLPVASGIGGGSSDAAAVLRALAVLWNIDSADPRLFKAAVQHGQDVPVCLRVENSYMTATGVMPAPTLPRVPVVLANPNKALPTPAVYKEYRHGQNRFSSLAHLEDKPETLEQLIDMLSLRHNDLFAPARRLLPEISDVIRALEGTNSCKLARMSGSGATCFGLYSSDRDAENAATAIRITHPEWWIAAGAINVE